MNSAVQWRVVGSDRKRTIPSRPKMWNMVDSAVRWMLVESNGKRIILLPLGIWNMVDLRYGGCWWMLVDCALLSCL